MTEGDTLRVHPLQHYLYSKFTGPGFVPWITRPESPCFSAPVIKGCSIDTLRTVEHNGPHGCRHLLLGPLFPFSWSLRRGSSQNHCC